MIDSIKAFISKYWFIISSICIAILYFIIDKRGRKISALMNQAQTQLLTQKLESIKEKSTLSEAHYEEAKQDYDTLKSNHADLLHKLGIGSASDKSNT